MNGLLVWNKHKSREGQQINLFISELDYFFYENRYSLKVTLKRVSLLFAFLFYGSLFLIWSNIRAMILFSLEDTT